MTLYCDETRTYIDTKVVNLHYRLFSWKIWEECNDTSKYPTWFDHPIVSREVVMGLAVCKKQYGDLIAKHTKYDINNQPGWGNDITYPNDGEDYVLLNFYVEFVE